jgi:hypothetical protein
MKKEGVGPDIKKSWPTDCLSQNQLEILFLGDKDLVTWPYRLGVSQMRQ